MKRFQVKATVTGRHVISVNAVDKEAAGIAAKEKFAAGRLAQALGYMEVTSVEEWPHGE